MDKKRTQKAADKPPQMTYEDIDDEHRDYLIELVEDKPLLWNPTDADYTSKGKKQVEWLDIDNLFSEVYPGARFGGIKLNLFLIVY